MRAKKYKESPSAHVCCVQFCLRLSTMVRSVVLLLASAFVAVQANPTVVSIYYESLCPDSIAFINTQFTPTYNELGKENIQVDYLPYGKARQTMVNGNWQFICQHGSDECRGNKMMACAIKYITDVDVLVQFIDCVMGSIYPPDAGNACATIHNVNWTPINTCWMSTESDDLLAAYGDRTHALTPAITFVPTIVFDGVFNQADQDESLTNFKAVTCRHLS
ncbi:hypothetical protein B566_EDAN011339, partial [Ephemera danica]